MVDLRDIIEDPNDIIGVSHPAIPCFINTITDAYDVLLTSGLEFEMARPGSKIKVDDDIDKRLSVLRVSPTKLVDTMVCPDLRALLAFFDMTSYGLFSLVLVDGSGFADYVVWPSPLGITPENALRKAFNKPLTDVALRVALVWSNSILSNEPVYYKVVLSDSTEVSVLGRSVKIIRDGVVVEGKYVRVNR